MDRNNLVYVSNSTVPKLVRWRVLLSDFRFQIEHIPVAQNVVADIFRMDNSVVEFQDTGDSGKENDEPEILGAQDEDSEVELSNGEAVFEKFHNLVGHLVDI